MEVIDNSPLKIQDEEFYYDLNENKSVDLGYENDPYNDANYENGNNEVSETETTAAFIMVSLKSSFQMPLN